MDIDFSEVRSLIEQVEAGKAAELKLLDMMTAPRVLPGKPAIQCDPFTAIEPQLKKPWTRPLPPKRPKACKLAVLAYLKSKFPNKVTVQELKRAGLPMKANSISSTASDLWKDGLIDKPEYAVFRAKSA